MSGIIKFLFFFFLISAGTLRSQDELLSKKVLLDPGIESLELFIDQLSEQTGILFSYSSQQINALQKIDFPPGRKSVDEILNILQKNYAIDFRIVENQVVLKQLGKEEMLELNQPLFSISGYLYDSASGESLIGAAIWVRGTGYGTVTNAFGYYSVSLPEGKYQLNYSYIAFENQLLTVNLSQNLTRSVFLKPSRIILPAVLIKTDLQRELLSNSQMSKFDIQPEQLEKIPEFGGEVGLIKGLQTLPGIKSHSDGSAFFYVRGGEKDQNMIIIDDAPVYNPSHLFGYYSMVIPDFTKDIQVYKSDMPVHLGDRLSSIIDIRTKDGNLNKFHMTGLLNPLVSRFSVEGPIFKGKSSFFTSFRSSNIQWIYRKYVPNLNFGFNDFNFKWNYIPNQNNRFFFSYFFGSDLLANNYSTDNSAGIRWNNMASSFRWNHIINKNTFVNTIFIASIYQYQLFLGGNNWRSNIANASLKMDFSYFPRPDIDLKYGLNISNHAFDPGSLTLSGNIQFFPSITFGKSKELGLYTKFEHRFNQRLSYGIGVRMPIWYNTGPTVLYLYNEEHQLQDTLNIDNNETYKGYVHLDPRLSISYQLDSNSSVKFSYGAYHQYIHLLSNSTSPFTSIEVWLPSGLNIKPQRADQLALGYFQYLYQQKLLFSAEMYYKFMQNQIDYKPHANMLLNPLVEGELRFGNAKAYGIELFLEKKYGKLNGWMSYTYSRVLRKTPEVNGGKAYRAFRDRPHDFSIFINFQFGKRSYVSANWTYYTGSAITMPEAYYEFNDQTIPVYGEKNNARLPDYHRLDLAYKYIINRPDSKYKQSLNFSLYNAYARKNPISINYNRIDDNGKLLIPTDLFGTEDLVFSQRDLLRIMPSISYKFEL